MASQQASAIAKWLGFQPAVHSRSSSRYAGVVNHKSHGRWQARAKIEEKLKHLGYFDIEVEAALAIRVKLLQAEGKEADAKEFEAAMEAVKRVVQRKKSPLSKKCSCGLDKGRCDCPEKALLEVATAMAAWQAARAQASPKETEAAAAKAAEEAKEGIVASLPAEARQPASAIEKPKEAKASTDTAAEKASPQAAPKARAKASTEVSAPEPSSVQPSKAPSGSQARKAPPSQTPKAAPPSQAPKAAPQSPAPKAAPQTPAPKAASQVSQAAKAPEAPPASAAKLAAAPAASAEEIVAARLQALRREHELQKRRGKEQRRADRVQKLEERAQKKAKKGQEETTGVKADDKEDAAKDERETQEAKADASEVKGEGHEEDAEPEPNAGALGRRRALRTMRAFIQETMVKWRVLTYTDALERLGNSFFSQSSGSQLHPSAPDTQDASLKTPYVQMPAQFFGTSGHRHLEETPKRKRRRVLVEPQELALKRLAEERRREAEQERLALERRRAEQELSIQDSSMDARTEWLLLQRMESGPVIVNAALSEAESLAVREELALQAAWEESGGRQEEEQILKKWRKSQLLRRQNYLLKRGAARWLHSRRGKAEEKVWQPEAEASEDPYLATEDPYLAMPDADEI
mmetsp:Transcript_44590/g.80173  ORF Transcript_44590/g.80173 Transcript_44590/m.80173 type:complete len:635 (+) Transcript_44590:89-1993(+)